MTCEASHELAKTALDYRSFPVTLDKPLILLVLLERMAVRAKE